MRSLIVLSFAVLLIPFSACLDPDADSRTVSGKAQLQGREPRTVEVIQQAAYEQIRQLMEGVPCDAPVTMDTSANLKKLHGLGFEQRGTNEIDIHDNMLLMARGGGFELFDISNPLVPYQLSNWTETKGNLDVKFSPDGMTAFIGAGYGIDIVDISSPLEPERTGQFRFDTIPTMPGELGRNAHMMYTAAIEDEQWLFLAPNSNTGVWILKIEGAPDARSLTYVTHTQAVEGGPLGPHDMYVQFDPDMKRWLLYSADGFHGWEVFDVTDPTTPTFVGGFVRPEGGYTHTIQASHINGKRIVVTVGEVGANIMEVYDANELETPILLGVWNIATFGTPNPAGLTFPQHNFNIVDGKMYLAHYGSGLFVFDLTKVTEPVTGTQDLQPIAHYASGGAAQNSPVSFGDFWDIVLKDGVVYGSNMRDGVHVIGFGCLSVGDRLLTSDG